MTRNPQGNGAMGARMDGDIRFGGVVFEPRDPRLELEARIPFRATMPGCAVPLEGIALAVGGFRVRAPRDGAAAAHLAAGARMPVQLRIETSGVTVEIPVVAEVARLADDVEVAFTRLDTGPQIEETLRRIVRACLAGHIATAEELLGRADPPTRDPLEVPKAAAIAAAEPARRRARFGFWGSLAVFAAIGLASGLAVLDAAVVTRSSFATVTAPSLEILSPALGRLDVEAPATGGRVARDTPLYRLEDPKLEAERIRARARVEHLELRSRVADAAAAAAAREDLRLAKADLRALDLLAAEATAHSPCDCVIVWRQEEGAFVQQGERVMTLAAVDPARLRVEALVSLEDAGDIRAGDPALVRFAGEAAPRRAVVQRVSLDPDDERRVGFPDWLRRDPRHASVVLRVEGVDAGLIGVHADVFMSERLPALAAARMLVARVFDVASPEGTSSAALRPAERDG